MRRVRARVQARDEVARGAIALHPLCSTRLVDDAEKASGTNGKGYNGKGSTRKGSAKRPKKWHSISPRCVRWIRRALTRTRLSPGFKVDRFVHDSPPELPEARAAAYRSQLLQRSRAQIEMRTSLLAVQIGCSGRCHALGHAISVSTGLPWQRAVARRDDSFHGTHRLFHELSGNPGSLISRMQADGELKDFRQRLRGCWHQWPMRRPRNLPQQALSL